MSEELQHHGILGMKWGVRRYQNYDGSYTQKGLERYKKAESNYNSAKSNYQNTKEHYNAGVANLAGGTVATSILGIKDYRDNKYLKAYYAHSSPKSSY